jgi:hypothetical protein
MQVCQRDQPPQRDVAVSPQASQVCDPKSGLESRSKLDPCREEINSLDTLSIISRPPEIRVVDTVGDFELMYTWL